jgi:VWFA-related protein
MQQTGTEGRLMRIDARLCCFLAAILLCTVAASAQQSDTSAPPAQSSPRSKPASAAPKGGMLLDVVVTAKSGPPVGDLQQQDFNVLDNKVPQTITSFKVVSGRDASIEVMLVLDAVNSVPQTVSLERLGIDKFISAEAGPVAYPLAIGIFTDKGLEIVGGQFSRDGGALAAQLDQADIGLRSNTRSQGYYGAVDRFALSINTLEKLVEEIGARPGRKIIVWISPGWPLLSGVRTSLDEKEKQHIFANIVSLSTQLRAGRVTIYSVDPLGNTEYVGRTSYYKEFIKGVSKPSEVIVGDLGLPVLAVQTGGLALNFNNDVAALLREAISDAAPYYEITFAPAPTDKRDDYHQLEVQVAKPGLTARTRQGYYAQPVPSH